MHQFCTFTGKLTVEECSKATMARKKTAPGIEQLDANPHQKTKVLCDSANPAVAISICFFVAPEQYHAENDCHAIPLSAPNPTR